MIYIIYMYMYTYSVYASKISLSLSNIAFSLYVRSKKYIAFCSTGYRSVIASSFLRSFGFDVVDIYGGFAAVSVSAPQLTTTGKVCGGYYGNAYGCSREVFLLSIRL